MKTNLHSVIISAVTAYDRAASKRRGYNIHALPLMMEACDRIEQMVDTGSTLQAALQECLSDRLLSHVERAISTAGIDIFMTLKISTK